MANITGLAGKLILKGRLKLKTGLHIGGATEFSAIGAVDSIVVRDPLKKQPYIPGSSLKGKMRYLIARVYAANGRLAKIEEENRVLKRLFGSSGENIILSRLQFFDLFMTEESVKKIEKMDTDLYLSEIKFENSIDRVTSIANPRQIERVPAGAEFDFMLAYNLENEDEFEEDMLHLGYGLKLLEEDYLGGHGSRGYGRIEFLSDDFAWEVRDYGALTGKSLGKGVEERAKKAFLKGKEGFLDNE